MITLCNELLKLFSTRSNIRRIYKSKEPSEVLSMILEKLKTFVTDTHRSTKLTKFFKFPV